MAEPTAVNSQITDSVLQPAGYAEALASFYAAMTRSLGQASDNAVTNQQNSSVLAQAALTQSVARILSAEVEVSK